MSGYYDLKVGYTCNNNCKHCVIDENRNFIIKQGLKQDLSYREIVELIDSQAFAEARLIVLTGGEITIRKDFIRILNYIKEKYGETKDIVIQTNGRKLKDFIPSIFDTYSRLGFVIALHGLEEVHNLVTDNRGGNPFKETWDSLIALRDYIEGKGKKFGDIARIEVVLSNYNLSDVMNLVRFCHDNRISKIGISYPHLDGFFRHDKERFNSLAFSYKTLRPIINELYSYCKDNSDLLIEFEELPQCARRDLEGNWLKPIDNFGSMEDSKNIAVKFPGQDVIQDFGEIFNSMHRKFDFCSKCVFCTCPGIWEEAYETFKDEGLSPVTLEEYNRVMRK